MTALNAFLVHKSCGGKMTYKKFRKMLVRELILRSQEENLTASGTSRSRPSPTVSHLSRLEVKHSQHWPSNGKQRRCRMCSLKKHTRTTLYFSRKCDVGLCIVKCFQKWHTCVNLNEYTQRVTLNSIAGGKLYRCSGWTENICRVNKCCIVL
jgi:hypothetical protein